MLRFHELSPSPNNTKVRMALRFKGVPFEAIEIDHADRQALREVSGQDLSPVIEDKGIVLNDSEAILNYLDANYRDAPRLIPADKESRRACDAWKTKLDKLLVPSWFDVFLCAIKVKDSFDPASPGRFKEGLAQLEGELREDGTFFGPDSPICELRAAEWLTYALPGQPLLDRVGVWKIFPPLFGVSPGEFPKLEAMLAPWQERLG